MEEAIASALSGIKDRLPGFKMFRDIYSNDHEIEKDLQKKILLAYIAFMDLSMEMTRYYFQAGYRMLFRVAHWNEVGNLTLDVPR